MPMVLCDGSAGTNEIRLLSVVRSSESTVHSIGSSLDRMPPTYTCAETVAIDFSARSKTIALLSRTMAVTALDMSSFTRTRIVWDLSVPLSLTVTSVVPCLTPLIWTVARFFVSASIVAIVVSLLVHSGVIFTPPG